MQITDAVPLWQQFAEMTEDESLLPEKASNLAWLKFGEVSEAEADARESA
jgi:hypothetical protein